MLERLTSLKKSKKGFTLVELIVVIVIIAILAAALVTSLIGYVNKAKGTAALVEANNAYVASQAYLSEYYSGNGTTITAGDIGATILAKVKTQAAVYLGTTTEPNITAISVDAKGTISSFSFTSSKSVNVTYTTADGWSY